ncbi:MULTISPECIES: hypothetical protein [unclassified Bacillus (in: firmicutes)]|uniref:hypothetical protein n=1 Tax=unclassified Bacillus (in: firmicutes) TaxID=185979 RepID=UPI000BF86469|nr:MULTISPECIES: hypothetical protein [unclassified Bacillus (in: firmicutes)]PEZ76340.1 hypothetical protein CN380_21315 [Bacillus sp. AFS017274]
MIAGTKGDVISTIPRVNGFKDAINDVGVTVTIQMSTYEYIWVLWSSTWNRKGGSSLDYPTFTAVFCSSDVMAVPQLTGIDSRYPLSAMRKTTVPLT